MQLAPRRFVVVLVAALWVTAPSGPASAGPPGEKARSLSQQGRKLYRTGAHAEAVKVFRNARAAHTAGNGDPWAGLSYFLGRSLSALERCDEALKEFARFPLESIPKGDLRDARVADEIDCTLKRSLELAEGGFCGPATAKLQSVRIALKPLQKNVAERIEALCTPASKQALPWIAVFGGTALIGTGIGMSIYATGAASDQLYHEDRAAYLVTDPNATGVDVDRANRDATDAEQRKHIGIGVAIGAGAVGIAALAYGIYRFASSPSFEMPAVSFGVDADIDRMGVLVYGRF